MKTPFLPLRLRSLAATLACTFVTASVFAQAPAPGAPAAPGTVPPAPGVPAPATAPVAPAATPAPKPLGSMEKNFIKNAGKSIYYQLELAKVAKTAVTDEKLARFRDSSLKDLTKAWEGLNKLAASRGEKVVGELTGGDKSDVERLGKLKEEKFLKQWLEDLSKEAKKLDKDFESASKNLQDPDVKIFAANYGPMVRGVFTSAEGAEKGLQKKR